MIKSIIDMFRVRIRTADYTIMNSMHSFAVTFRILSTVNNFLEV